MIIVRNLYVRLGDYELKIDDLKIDKGEYVVIMGPSGVGKTVFLYTLLGIIKPIKGEIIIHDKNVTHAPINKREIAIVPENYALWPHLTVYDNIAYGLRIKGYSEKEIKEKVWLIAKELGIERLLKRKPSTLSAGEQQRVAFARALIVEPDIILLDEPFSRLDPVIKMKAIKMMKELHVKKGFTAIHITHNIIEALILANRVVYMESGRIKHVSVIEEFLGSKYVKPYIDELLKTIRYINGG